MGSQVCARLGLLVLLCFSLCAARVYTHGGSSEGKNNAEIELRAPHYHPERQGFFKNSEPVTPYDNSHEAASPPGHGCADSVHPPPPSPGHGCANNYSHVTPVPPNNELANSDLGIKVPAPPKY